MAAWDFERELPQPNCNAMPGGGGGYCVGCSAADTLELVNALPDQSCGGGELEIR